MSARHLSFIETGRARPSVSMLAALAERLDVPLRERNRMLLAAGYAPRYQERSLDDAEMSRVRAALETLLAAHEPNPGVVLDRQWNVVLANRPAAMLTAGLPAFLQEPRLNIFRASLHPDGLAAATENFDEWAGYLLQTLERAAETARDPGLDLLQREVLAYPTVQRLRARERRDAAASHPLLVPFTLRTPIGRLSLFTTLTTFGTPRDISLEELCIELFYPVDAETERLLRAAL